MSNETNSPEHEAARAYDRATGRDHRRWHIVRFAEGTRDTGERWIWFHVRTRAGFAVRVIERDGKWVADDVREARPEEIAI